MKRTTTAGANRVVLKSGLPAIELENDFLRLTILPSVGAKIYDLFWKEKARAILWHNPRIAPQPYPVDANFDNYWCGGWDEGFPTCDPCEYGGEQYPALGELRSLTWEVEDLRSRDGEASVKLFALGPISPVRATKTITLRSGSATVNIRSEIENLGLKPLDFIWGSHPALEVNEHMRIFLPAGTGLVALASDERMGSPGQRYHWPLMETPQGMVDMSRVLSMSAAINGGHYALELAEGFYAVEDPRKGTGFLLQWPLQHCPYVWMWLVYGGWRGHYHIVIEPWTSCPNTLTGAVAAKTNRRLAVGETFSIELNATVYQPPETHLDALKRVQGKT